MSAKVIQLRTFTGLQASDVAARQKQYGKNIFQQKSSRNFFRIAWDILRDPMFLLLIIAAALYLVLGDTNEGFMMLAAMTFVAAISLFQEMKSSRALQALKQYTEPRVTVIRDGKDMIIATEDLVPGDLVMLEEGMKVVADATILQENDFTADESILTGESIPVEKNEQEGHNLIYQGTTVNSGKCIARVLATGNNTILGKLGKTVGSYQSPKTLLQLQLNHFVKRFALLGFIGFVIIFLVNYLHYHQWATSLLFALTMALSVIPEEIPVAFSSFMALGAYQMSKLGIISRQPQVVETLGAVNVICLDKTGTITENKMQVKFLYDYKTDTVLDLSQNEIMAFEQVLVFGMLASEKDPFDSMEKAIWEAFETKVTSTWSRQLNMVYEYPLQGEPPMMTHVYASGENKIAAAKGAPEKIISVCRLPDPDKRKVTEQVMHMASRGYRVIGVAGADHKDGPMPVNHDEFMWRFKGLLFLYDPPRENMADVIRKFQDAGIKVKLLTGDFPQTAVNIAGQVGITGDKDFVTGEQVNKMTDEELKQVAMNTNIFARVFPETKLRIIEALKANGDIVAMTGDGVNDGPALKASSVGIALGKKGTEIARQAADLVITDDNLERMVTAISEGRKIFSNLKKAIRYIISIHIPIILVASVPLIFNWVFPNIFTPVHIIFLELIMGPTCSVFFEREPMEADLMRMQPRAKTVGLFTREELMVSIVQGLIIAGGILVLYYQFMNSGKSIEYTRMIVFTTLIFSNVFLTFTNRSFSRSLYYTLRYKNNLVPWIVLLSVLFLVSLHFIPFVQALFRIAPVNAGGFWLSFGVAATITLWFELYKTFFIKSEKK
jgi:P-type Ca2+ transporter type 2C